jgi:hypothetical protein
MDSRKTINTAQSFLELINEYYANQERVSLLIDQEGLTRLEGLITSVQMKDNSEDAVIQIDKGTSFSLADLIAVNGNFRSDFTEFYPGIFKSVEELFGGC